MKKLSRFNLTQTIKPNLILALLCLGVFLVLSSPAQAQGINLKDADITIDAQSNTNLSNLVGYIKLFGSIVIVILAIYLGISPITKIMQDEQQEGQRSKAFQHLAFILTGIAIWFFGFFPLITFAVNEILK